MKGLKAVQKKIQQEQKKKQKDVIRIKDDRQRPQAPRPAPVPRTKKAVARVAKKISQEEERLRVDLEELLDLPPKEFAEALRLFANAPAKMRIANDIQKIPEELRQSIILRAIAETQQDMTAAQYIARNVPEIIEVVAGDEYTVKQPLTRDEERKRRELMAELLETEGRDQMQILLEGYGQPLVVREYEAAEPYWSDLGQYVEANTLGMPGKIKEERLVRSRRQKWTELMQGRLGPRLLREFAQLMLENPHINSDKLLVQFIKERAKPIDDVPEEFNETLYEVYDEDRDIETALFVAQAPENMQDRIALVMESNPELSEEEARKEVLRMENIAAGRDKDFGLVRSPETLDEMIAFYKPLDRGVYRKLADNLAQRPIEEAREVVGKIKREMEADEERRNELYYMFDEATMLNSLEPDRREIYERIKTANPHLSGQQIMRRILEKEGWNFRETLFGVINESGEFEIIEIDRTKPNMESESYDLALRSCAGLHRTAPWIDGVDKMWIASPNEGFAPERQYIVSYEGLAKEREDIIANETFTMEDKVWYKPSTKFFQLLCNNARDAAKQEGNVRTLYEITDDGLKNVDVMIGYTLKNKSFVVVDEDIFYDEVKFLEARQKNVSDTVKDLLTGPITAFARQQMIKFLSTTLSSIGPQFAATAYAEISAYITGLEEEMFKLSEGGSLQDYLEKIATPIVVLMEGWASDFGILQDRVRMGYYLPSNAVKAFGSDIGELAGLGPSQLPGLSLTTLGLADCLPEVFSNPDRFAYIIPQLSEMAERSRKQFYTNFGYRVYAALNPLVRVTRSGINASASTRFAPKCYNKSGNQIKAGKKVRYMFGGEVICYNIDDLRERFEVGETYVYVPGMSDDAFMAKFEKSCAEQFDPRFVASVLAIADQQENAAMATGTSKDKFDADGRPVRIAWDASFGVLPGLPELIDSTLRELESNFARTADKNAFCRYCGELVGNTSYRTIIEEEEDRPAIYQYCQERCMEDDRPHRKNFGKKKRSKGGEATPSTPPSTPGK